jgi:hypothetical protein
VEDMTAEGDGLEIFNKGFEIFVADRANGLAKARTTGHRFLSLFLFLFLTALSSVCLIFLGQKNGANFEK